MKKSLLKLIIILVLAGLSILALILFFNKKTEQKNAPEAGVSEKAVEIKEEKKDRIKKIDINDGDTYGVIMTNAGIDYATQMEIYNAAKGLYDLVKIRCGRCLEFVYDKDTDEFKELVYQIDSEEKLHVRRIKIESNESASSTEAMAPTYSWQAEIKPIEYEVRIKISSGTVESSMYQAALDSNIDERAIIELADAFQWTIDFALDPRKGDTFKFVYEERYLNGEYVMPGRILAGEYINAGEKYEVYYFDPSAGSGQEDEAGYYDKDGNSVQKMFLKAPVAFRYISSGFTTGLRYIEAFNVSTGHRAVDYAAALGTPIRAVGDGTVTFAGWSSAGYGRLVSIRHNGTYSTNYGHQSKIAVRVGQKVKQGDVIGYVGSTGFSTGPHLHYEMVKNGAKINPLKEVLPPGKAIEKENQERFFAEVKKYQAEMEK